jgi:hypothetical protein
LSIRGFVLDVEPFLAPALDGVGKLQIKIAGFWSNTDTDTTYIVDGVLRVVAAEVEDTFPQALMGVDSKETLA